MQIVSLSIKHSNSVYSGSDTETTFGQWNVVVKNTSSLETGIGINDFSVINPAPTLTGTGITPTSGYNNNTALPFTVTGTNFISGARVNLTKSLSPNITATISSYSGNTITGTLDISTAANGTWYVYVTNPDEQVTSEVKTFTINWPLPTISGFIPSQSINNGPQSMTINGNSFQVRFHSLFE